MHVINQVLSQVSYWSVIVPLGVGVITFRYLKVQSKWVLLLVLLATIPQVMQAVWHGSSYRNLSFNLYTVLEFVVMIQVLQARVVRKGWRLVMYGLVAVFAMACIFLFFARGIGNSFISELVCLSSAAYLVLLLAILQEVYVLNLPFFEKQDPFTYFFAGILPYVAVTLIFFALYNKIQESDHDSPWRIMNTFHSVLNSLMYLLFAIGFWVNYKTSKQLSAESKFVAG